MKFIKNPFIYTILVLAAPGWLSGQTAVSRGVMQAPVLSQPIVIPANPSSSAQPAAQQAEPVREAASSAPADHAGAVIHAPQPSPAQGDFSNFGRISLQGQGRPGDEPAGPARPPTKDERYERMILEMREAVQAVAARHGNPMFAHVFTNDTLRAQLLRKRVLLLQRIDDVHAEIAALENQKTDAKREVDAARAELLALQKQTGELNERLSKARMALSFAPQPMAKDKQAQ